MMNETENKTNGNGVEGTAPPLTILLVEDERADGYLINWAMKKNSINVNVFQVYDGYEALAYLRRLGSRFAKVERPALILLDLSMPRMGGLEFLKNIKEDAALSDIPVVVLSTSCAASDMAVSLEKGAADYYTKPLDIHQLVENIRLLGDRWILPHIVPPDGH
jgi:CheY-like chemotaxis protein